MDLKIIILSKVSQKEKEKYHCDITYKWNIKYNTDISTKQKRTHRLVVAEGKGERGG